MDQKEKQMGDEIQTPQEATQEIPKEEKSTGAIIGIIIIVVLLAIGGLYFLGQRTNKEPVTPEEILAKPDTSIEALGTQGSSDEVAAIEADTGATKDLGNLDVELGNIDAELSL